jgi:tyrosine aminotransferase
MQLERTAGYVNACGAPAVRAAIAKFHSDDDSINAGNVIVANGCSGALELALTALLDDDSIVLIPSPGFPLYKVIAQSHGSKTISYRLDPDTWQIDLDQLEEIILTTQRQEQSCGNIRAMIVNNPSNPTGAVMTERHLQQIARTCARHRIAIIADEVYGDLVFGDCNEGFHPMAKVVKSLGSLVPVITASGIGKQFLLPGWRVGWIVFQDKCVQFLLETGIVCNNPNSHGMISFSKILETGQYIRDSEAW